MGQVGFSSSMYVGQVGFSSSMYVGQVGFSSSMWDRWDSLVLCGTGGIP